MKMFYVERRTDSVVLKIYSAEFKDFDLSKL